VFFVSESEVVGLDDSGHTVNAFISHLDIDIDGNAWRDIEAGDHLEEFFSQVVFGETDAEDFLSHISESLCSENSEAVL